MHAPGPRCSSVTDCCGQAPSSRLAPRILGAEPSGRPAVRRCGIFGQDGRVKSMNPMSRAPAGRLARPTQARDRGHPRVASRQGPFPARLRPPTTHPLSHPLGLASPPRRHARRAGRTVTPKCPMSGCDPVDPRLPCHRPCPLHRPSPPHARPLRLRHHRTPPEINAGDGSRPAIVEVAILGPDHRRHPER